MRITLKLSLVLISLALLCGLGLVALFYYA